MKQFLVLLVFTLGKEYRVLHRVLYVVVLGFGSSLCSLCCWSPGVGLLLRTVLS